MKGIGIVLFLDYEIAKVYYEIQGNEGTMTLVKMKRDYTLFEEEDLTMQLKFQNGIIRDFFVWKELEDEKFKIKLHEPVPDN